MSDTRVKLVAQIDATSKGLVDALNQAQNAVNSTTSNMQKKFDGLNSATNKIGEHVQKLSELIRNAGDGVIDENAVQTELKALEQAQAEVIEASRAFDSLASSAQKAEKSITDGAQSTAKATTAVGAMTDKIKVGGIALKDFKDAFSNSATSAVAMGNIYATLISNIITGFSKARTQVQALADQLKRIEDLRASTGVIKATSEADDTGKLASKMKELYELRENWSGTETQKAQQQLLIDDISWLQQFQKEEDRITVAMNGQVIAQNKLRMAIADTLELEQQMRKNTLQTSLGRDKVEFERLAEEMLAWEEVELDLKNSLKAMWHSGNFNPLNPVEIGLGLAGKDLTAEKLKVIEDYEKAQQQYFKTAIELKKLNQESNADNFIYVAHAQAQDKANEIAKEKANQEQEEENQRINANAKAIQIIYELNLSDLGREREQALNQISEEFGNNILSGMEEEYATQIKNLKIAEVEKKYADAVARQEEAEKKKNQELLDAMQKRVEAYQQSYQKYLDAEAEVDRAKKAYADAQKDLARETQRDAINKRRNAIRERLNTFGFRVADNFALTESAHDRHARAKQQKTDASISEKMAQWEAGKKVHFSVAERERLAEYEGLKNEDKSLEAVQKQMDAARQTENAAERLSSAAEAVKRAADRLEESKGELKKSKSGIDDDKIEEAEAIVKAKSRNTRGEPARHYGFSPSFEPESKNDGDELKIYGKSNRLEHGKGLQGFSKLESGKGLQGLKAKGLNATNAKGISYSDQLAKIHATLQDMARNTFRVK